MQIIKVVQAKQPNNMFLFILLFRPFIQTNLQELFEMFSIESYGATIGQFSLRLACQIGNQKESGFFESPSVFLASLLMALICHILVLILYLTCIVSYASCVSQDLLWHQVILEVLKVAHGYLQSKIG